MTSTTRLQTQNSRFEAYLAVMDERVEGWFARIDGLLMATCLSIQREEHIAGAIAEIGVHHGKSFLALACAAPDEIFYAVDVFERQDLNIDRSGRGDKEIFLANCKLFAPDASVSILAMSSIELRGRERELMSPLRFLSIDGGHTRDITLNDLEIADAILVDGGMCCIDDVLHPEWTGVISGIFAFMERSETLVPFALTPNKLYWCRPQFQDARRTQFQSRFSGSLKKRNRELGRHLVDVYVCQPCSAVLARPRWSWRHLITTDSARRLSTVSCSRRPLCTLSNVTNRLVPPLFQMAGLS